MTKYIVITSDTPEKVIKYLKNNKLDFKEFEFNEILDLSDVPHKDKDNGRECWKRCDNFIKGLEWEDYRIKPRNSKEAQEGNLSEHRTCNRGWTKFLCKAYIGKEKFIKWDGGKKITDNNPKGIVDNCSWIGCDYCQHYSPKTLKGQIHVLVKIREQYQNREKELNRKIENLEAELKKNESQM